MRTARRAILLTVLAAPLALPASAPALGLPTTFPRTIAITSDKQDVRVSRFQVATRAVGLTQMRVTVNVDARSLSGGRNLLVGVAPCSGGSLTSPSCVPKATWRLRLGQVRTSVSKIFLVPRPSVRRDAVRVTLSVGTRTSDIPYRTANVGGGGGTGEILLNGGTWRFRQGTFWGLEVKPASGIVVDRVWFNSRRYEWSGTAPRQTSVTTQIGYFKQKPRWTFVNTMRAGTQFKFHRTPSSPVQERRSSPRSYAYRADVATGALFSMLMPLPAFAGS
jgi:hypothetical protein